MNRIGGRVSFGSELFPKHQTSRLGLTSYRRCQHCGMLNDTQTTAWSKRGDGLVKTAEPSTDSDGLITPAEFTAKSGCRHCGSLYWTSYKPRKLKNEDVSLTRWRSRRRWR